MNGKLPGRVLALRVGPEPEGAGWMAEDPAVPGEMETDSSGPRPGPRLILARSAPKTIEGVDYYCRAVCGQILRHGGLCKGLCARRRRMMEAVSDAAIRQDTHDRILKIRKKRRAR